MSKLKAQKKVLVGELRGLRDLGIYEGRITVDHAPPATSITTTSAVPSSSFTAQLNALDIDSQSESDPIDSALTGEDCSDFMAGTATSAGAGVTRDGTDDMTPNVNSQSNMNADIKKNTKYSASISPGCRTNEAGEGKQLQERGINFAVLKVRVNGQISMQVQSSITLCSPIIRSIVLYNIWCL